MPVFTVCDRCKGRGRVELDMKCDRCEGRGTVELTGSAFAPITIPMYPTVISTGERCICAAIRTVEGVIVRGHRHYHCFRSAADMNLTADKNPESQGFVTS